MGVEFELDAVAVGEEAAQRQRALLATVQAHDTDPAAAVQAAAELLRWYVRFERMDDAGVQVAIEEGIAAVMLKAASAALEIRPGARVDVTPLDFFPFQRRAGKGGGPKKAGAKERMLQLRAAHGDYLTEAEARGILTTLPGKDGKRRTLPREQWPATVASVERALVDHMAGTYTDVPAEQRRAFVRESVDHFWPLSWGKPRQRVAYPAHW